MTPPDVLDTRQPRTPRRQAAAVALTALGGLASGLAAVSVLAYAGRHWWILDLTASFRVQYLWFLLLAVPILAAGRRRVAAVLAAGGVLVNLVAVAPLFLADPAPAIPGSPTVTVMSFNVHASNDNYQAVIEQLRASDADIIFVIEVNRRWENAFEAAGLPILASRSELGTADMLVISRHEYEVELVPLTGRDGVLVRVPFGATILDVLGVHPVSPIKGEYDYRRDRMLGSVGEWVASAGVPTLVIGDLNSTPWTAAFRDLEASGLVNSLRGYGVQPTWPAGFGPFMIPIDHALHTPDLTTADRTTGPADGSDHRSLTVTVAEAAG